MISKRFLSLTISCLIFLHFSKAQGVRLLAIDDRPLEGAMVSFSNIEGSRTSVELTDNRGVAKAPSLSCPVIRLIKALGYKDKIDTIKQSSNSVEQIKLEKVSGSLGEVVVTGNLLPSYQTNSVYAVDVIGRDEIDRKAANNIRDLISQELNMRVSNDPSLGSSVSIQGTGGEHIKFLIDGVPVIGRQNGNIDLSQLNLSNIDHVEIIKGPMSVLYGSDALGGVINLVTKKNTSENLTAGVNTYFENIGVYNVDAFAGWGFKNSSFTISGGRNFFDGWSDHDTSRWQQWKPKEQYFGNLKWSQSIKGFRFSVSGDFFEEKVTNKSNTIITPYFATASDQYFYTRRMGSQLDLDKMINERSSAKFTGSYSYYRYIKNTYIKNMVDLTEQLSADTLDDDTTRYHSVFARGVYSLSNKKSTLVLTSGSEFNYESIVGKRIDDAEHRITDLGVFASLDYKPVSNLTIRPALRGIYNSSFNAPLIPSLNLLYNLSSATAIRLSWSKGFRAPSLKEQYLDFDDRATGGPHNIQGNPDLKAETSDNVMASVAYKMIAKKIIWSIEPSVFYNHIRDRISLVEANANSSLYTYLNLDDFTSRGAELKSKISFKNIHVEAGYSYTGTNEHYAGQQSQPGIAWFSELNASADYTFEKSKTTFSLFWKYIGEQPTYVMGSDGNFKRFENESYDLMDASIRQPLLKNKIALTIGAKNIFDVKSIKMTDTGGAHSGNSAGASSVGMGISYFVKLSLSI